VSENEMVALDVQTPQAPHDLALSREPEVVLGEAQRAAAALKSVLDKKPRKVMLHGSQYLEYEDWATLGKFYGVTAKVAQTNPVEVDGIKGYEARAVAFHVPTGQEISGAEAMCLSNEANWIGKPAFQLRSMAQTRACAKALRNVLSWVVVLAGYRPTPAEEMTDETPRVSFVPKDVKAYKSKRGKEFYVVESPAGVLYTTFDKRLAEDARDAKHQELPVSVEYQANSFGALVKDLSVLGAKESENAGAAQAAAS
jgi:hypothetical protein